MADTVQLVVWSLGQKCALRPECDAVVPQTLKGTLAKAKAYSKGLRDKRVFGDVYVSSYTYGKPPGGNIPTPSLSYPEGGFVVSEAFRECGGPDQLFEMCGNCPANTTPHDLVGCAGSLYQSPYSPETEEQLRRITSRLGLDAEVEEAFPRTARMWFGFWAVSPVPRRSLGPLRTLISEMLAEDRLEAPGKGRHLRDFALFIKATELALERDLHLQVALLPPGHTDFGVYTVFPHCPFCKAMADTERWQRRYPSALQACRVCGTEFSPAETASMKRMKWDDDDNLRKILGRERFKELAREYLIAFGNTAETAEAIVVATEAAEDERAAEQKQREELAARRRRFLAEHIFAGLQTVKAPPSEIYDDEEEEDSNTEPAPRWFDRHNFEEVLRRSVAAGLRVPIMVHVSADGELDRTQDSIGDPLEVLRTWLEEGCAEKFYAHFAVPDALVLGEQPPPA